MMVYTRAANEIFSPELPSEPAHPVGGTSLGDAAPAGDVIRDGVRLKLLGLVAKPLGSALPSGHNPSQKRSRETGQRARAARTPPTSIQDAPAAQTGRPCVPKSSDRGQPLGHAL